MKFGKNLCSGFTQIHYFSFHLAPEHFMTRWCWFTTGWLLLLLLQGPYYRV